MPAGPDFSLRTPEGVARLFEYFGEVECPQLDAPLYQHLCRGVAGDEALLALAAHAPATQPPPNLLFAAVHYLLLGGEQDALREWYPAFAGGTCRQPESAFPAFRAFCLRHREAIAGLVASRLTQTNVIQRCSALLPAFAHVFARAGGRPLALIEIGASAGLNLQWDRYRYAYRREGGRTVALAWGDPGSGVLVECELRGEAPLPALPDPLPVAWRRGVDIHPIDLGDADAVRWLRALVWPEHVGRQERLTAAIEVARRNPPPLLEADASTALPDLIASVPPDAAPCLYGTHTLYQFPRDALRATLRAMQAASTARPVWFASCEGTGDRCSELRLTEYRDGGRETMLLARCNPHGRWLEWLA
jgi:hypothetical protein